MPQDNQDLFNVMDSALKRQGEGVSRRFRAVSERSTSERHAKPSSKRTSARQVSDDEVAREMPAAPPLPEAPTISERPAAPAPAGNSGAPATPPAAAGGAMIHIPEYQRVDGQPNTRDITRRLYPMPESSKVLPTSGSLSPGQVLRGTVFSGNRFRPQPGQSQGEQTPAAEEAQPQDAAPVLPPMPEPTAVPLPAVSAPMPQAAAPQQQPSTPAPQTPPYGPASTRQAPVRGIASGTLRSRPSAILTPSVRPSGSLSAQPPASPASGQYDRSPAAAQSGGFFVRTEVASVVLIGVVVSLVLAFLLGHRMGESSALRSADPEKGKVEKPLMTSRVPAPLDLDSPPASTPPASPVAPVTPPVQAPVTPVAPATGRYALRVRSYNERSTAEKLVAQLRGKGIPEPRVLESSGVFKVIVGRFPSKTDPGIEQLRQRIVGFKEWRSFRPDIVQE